jgi:hypothetical protein
METFTLPHAIPVAGFQVESFPLGISDAFEELASLLPKRKDQSYYGITKMDANGTKYFVAAANVSIEEHTKLRQLLIADGVYRVRVVRDWQRNLSAIPHIFHELLQQKDVEHGAPCVEWYKDDKEMLCMVKLQTSNEVND